MKLGQYTFLSLNRVNVQDNANLEIMIKIPENKDVTFLFYYGEDSGVLQDNSGYRYDELHHNLQIMKAIQNHEQINFFYEIYPTQEKTAISYNDLIEKIESVIHKIDFSRI